MHGVVNVFLLELKAKAQPKGIGIGMIYGKHCIDSLSLLFNYSLCTETILIHLLKPYTHTRLCTIHTKRFYERDDDDVGHIENDNNDDNVLCAFSKALQTEKI